MNDIRQPSEYTNKIILFSLFFYAFTAIAFPDISDFFKAIIILGTIFSLCFESRALLKSPFFIFLGLFITIQILSWINSLIYIPEYASSLPKLDRITKLLLFFIFAYWLKGSTKNVLILWGLYVLGYITACAISSDNIIDEIMRGYQGLRIDFNIKNAMYTSMSAGTAFLFSLFYLLIRHKSQQNLKMAEFLIIIVLITILAFILVVTQSRQAWLAITITSILSPIYYFTINRKKKVNLKIALMIALSYLLLLFAAANSQTIKNRVIHTEQNTLSHLVNLDFDNIPMSSIGIRVNSWIEAIAWIKKHPLIGTDSKTAKVVISQSEKFNNADPAKAAADLKHLEHMHNSYFDISLAYGLIGLFSILAMYLYVPIQLYKNRYYIPNFNIIMFASLILLTYWFVINNFENFMLRSYGVSTSNIILASLYTFALHAKINKSNKG